MCAYDLLGTPQNLIYHIHLICAALFLGIILIVPHPRIELHPRIVLHYPPIISTTIPLAFMSISIRCIVLKNLHRCHMIEIPYICW